MWVYGSSEHIAACRGEGWPRGPAQRCQGQVPPPPLPPPLPALHSTAHSKGHTAKATQQRPLHMHMVHGQRRLTIIYTSFSNGARCVPETDYSDSDHDSGTEGPGGGVEEDPELRVVSEEEEDMDEFSADPSQW